MTRSVLLGALALGLFANATSASATGVYINGVYTESGSTITLPASGQMTISTAPGGTHSAPMVGTTYDTTTIAPTYDSGQYQVINAQPATQHTSQPAQTTTYSTAPATSYIEQPTVITAPAYAAEPAQSAGWKARRIYVAARAGVVLAEDTDFRVSNQGGGADLRIDNSYDSPGYTGSLAVGYQGHAGGIRYRTELEGGYQSSEVEQHNIRGVGVVRGADALGDTNVLYGFVNLYGDLPVSDRVALTAGGGIGAGLVEFDGHGTRANGIALNDDSVAFGYHLDAGVSYQVTEDVALEASYRYQSFVGAELTTENGNKTDVDVSSHNILAGVRVGF